jgi:hypothetical protein
MMALRGFPVVEIDVADMVDRLSNHISSHYLQNILNDDGEDLRGKSEYFRYYMKFRCDKQNGLWTKRFLGKGKNVNFWVTPWGGNLKVMGNKYLDLDYLLEHTDSFLNTYENIKREGYRPEKYGFITGQLLVNSDGEKRFIIWNGYRRSLSLAKLGYKKVKVEISGGNRWMGEIQNHFVKIDELKDWQNVKNGLYTKEEAKRFFLVYFGTNTKSG